MIPLFFKWRWKIAGAYWFGLTVHLLLSNPWTFFGREIAEHPPMDTSSPVSSFFLHGGAFAVLTGLLFFAAIPDGWNRFKKWAGIAFVHGCMTEGLQMFVPNRWPSWDDIFSNGFGVIATVWFASLLLKKGYVLFWLSLSSEKLFADNRNRRKAAA